MGKNDVRKKKRLYLSDECHDISTHTNVMQ